VTHARPAAPARWRRPAAPLTAPPRQAGSRTRQPEGTTADRADRDSGRTWLRNAMAALGILAAAAAVVSWDAQYAMVHSVKRASAVAALEAGIPDAGALIFASLGIALALHGRRALRPRTLNLACVGISLAMNAMAAGQGWRDMAIWVMPAAVYALASDTLIGVVRAWALARMRPGARSLDGEEVTPLAVAGAAALWLLRLASPDARWWPVNQASEVSGHLKRGTVAGWAGHLLFRLGGLGGQASEATCDRPSANHRLSFGVHSRPCPPFQALAGSGLHPTPRSPGNRHQYGDQLPTREPAYSMQIE
jgi:hypothetical protein